MGKHSKIDALDELDDEAQEAFEALEADFKRYRLPFKRFETYRTQARQDYLYSKGRPGGPPGTSIVTHTRSSKHTKRRAVDYILDVDSSIWIDGDPGHPWYTGIKDEQIENRMVYMHWLLLGRLGKSHGLVWGGDWLGNKPKRLLGWDPFHLELP